MSAVDWFVIDFWSGEINIPLTRINICDLSRENVH